MVDHHFGSEDLLDAPGVLQIAVTVVRLEQVAMARVLGDLDELLHCNVGLR